MIPLDSPIYLPMISEHMDGVANKVIRAATRISMLCSVRAMFLTLYEYFRKKMFESKLFHNVIIQFKVRFRRRRWELVLVAINRYSTNVTSIIWLLEGYNVQ